MKCPGEWGREEEPQRRSPGQWVSATWPVQQIWELRVQVSSVAPFHPCPHCRSHSDKASGRGLSTHLLPTLDARPGVISFGCWTFLGALLLKRPSTWVPSLFLVKPFAPGCRMAHRKTSRRNNCSATIWFKCPQPSRASFSKLKQTQPQWLKFCPLVITSSLP